MYLSSGYEERSDPFSYFGGEAVQYFMRDDDGDKIFRFAGVLQKRDSLRDGKGSIGNLVDISDLETRTALVRCYTYLVYKDAMDYVTYYARNPY